jgi:hypothetical protein
MLNCLTMVCNTVWLTASTRTYATNYLSAVRRTKAHLQPAVAAAVALSLAVPELAADGWAAAAPEAAPVELPIAAAGAAA